MPDPDRLVGDRSNGMDRTGFSAEMTVICTAPVAELHLSVAEGPVLALSCWCVSFLPCSGLELYFSRELVLAFKSGRSRRVNLLRLCGADVESSNSSGLVDAVHSER